MKKLILSQLNHQKAVSKAVDIIQHQGVVILPTETVYGLMTAFDNRLGKERIIQIKQRPQEKHFQVLIDSIVQANEMGAIFDKRAKLLSKAFWPGPMTIILPTVNGETVGLRMPNYDLVREIIRELGQPLAATSANISGEPPLKGVSKVDGYFFDVFPDLVIDDGERVDNTASTVISLCDEKLIVLREGIISKREIDEVLA